MALVNITPVMTSNTTPAPYVVSASSEYAAINAAWIAFNGTNTIDNDCWATSASTLTGWLKINFNTPQRIDAFSITGRLVSMVSNPKNFILYGSNDDLMYDMIKSIDNQILWSSNETRLFKLQTSVSYKYYKLVISTNNGDTYISAISKLTFWQDDEIVESVTNKKASINYCLPRNSTSVMNQRSNDSREGLLGFADDADNYGTLYMIDNKGQAMIPLVRQKVDIIFTGNASVDGTYTLINSISKYKSLTFYIKGATTASNIVGVTVNVIDFLLSTSTTNRVIVGMPYNLSAISYILIYYASLTSVTISIVKGSYTTMSLVKIVGNY